MRKTLFLVILLLAGLCLPAAAAAVTDTTKSLIVSFDYKDGTVVPADVRVIYGHPPDNLANRDLVAGLTAGNGSTIGMYGIEDPRVMYTDSGAVLKREVRFAVFLPFSPAADHVDLFDGGSGQRLATADVTAAIKTFCSGNREDPDCGGGGQPLPLSGGLPLFAVMLTIAGMILTRKLQ